MSNCRVLDELAAKSRQSELQRDSLKAGTLLGQIRDFGEAFPDCRSEALELLLEVSGTWPLQQLSGSVSEGLLGLVQRAIRHWGVVSFSKAGGIHLMRLVNNAILGESFAEPGPEGHLGMAGVAVAGELIAIERIHELLVASQIDGKVLRDGVQSLYESLSSSDEFFAQHYRAFFEEVCAEL
jgi:hypothetical protein